jgi:hypothetical protein
LLQVSSKLAGFTRSEVLLNEKICQASSASAKSSQNEHNILASSEARFATGQEAVLRFGRFNIIPERNFSLFIKLLGSGLQVQTCCISPNVAIDYSPSFPFYRALCSRSKITQMLTL